MDILNKTNNIKLLVLLIAGWVWYKIYKESCFSGCSIKIIITNILLLGLYSYLVFKLLKIVKLDDEKSDELKELQIKKLKLEIKNLEKK